MTPRRERGPTSALSLRSFAPTSVSVAEARGFAYKSPDQRDEITTVGCLYGARGHRAPTAHWVSMPRSATWCEHIGCNTGERIFHSRPELTIRVDDVIGALAADFLGDAFGRRLSYQVNLLVFGLASLSAAPTMSWLVAARFSHGAQVGRRDRCRLFDAD